jgi:putative transposase
VPTWSGFVFLAVVIVAFSRRVVGGSMAAHLRTELVLEVLDMALAQRRPLGVTFHSDQGCKYTCFAFGKRCRQMGVRPSMASVGVCFDNAMAESFFANLECELIDRTTFRNHAEAKMAMFEFLEGCYNPQRRHFGLGQRSPISFESRLQHAA